MASDIAKRLEQLREELKTYPDVTFVAVSKTKPIEAVQEAYNAGQRIFGENIVQELTQKYEVLPKDIQWHLIGHLQTNKVKYIAPFVSLIHGVDSFKLLQEIDKQGAKNNRVIDCLLQVHIAEEETKFGFDYVELVQMLESEDLKSLPNVRVVGLMGIATNTPKQEYIKEEFYELRNLFEGVKKSYFSKDKAFQVLSMGMSSDYTIALEEGSTMIRLGSTIFGQRVVEHWKKKLENNSN